MANKARGFVEFDLGGRKVEVSLGLGALAEIEDAFGVESFEEAIDFGDKISARALLKLSFAILKGNGFNLTEAEDAFVRQMSVPELMEVISGLLGASNMKQQAETGEAKDGKRPLVGKSAGKRG
jgi:hypothetical protein